jgi:electron transfer flavoprotein alpha subunit
VSDLWVVAEVAPDGGLARISAEIATLARTLAEASGGSAGGIVVAADPQRAASDLAAYLPRVVAVADPRAGAYASAVIVAEHVARVVGDGEGRFIFTSAGPDGRDLAGSLVGLLGWGVLANATAVSWSDGRPAAEASVFGGRLITTGTLTGDRGIVTVRPNAATAAAAASAGQVETAAAGTDPVLPPVTVVDRVVEAEAVAPMEEARVIVSGGRGVGGPEGFKVVEELAQALGGVVGASRAAVDSGWIPYSHQVGQTGKIVKPQLYVALGISGAIQHKVGMQTAETIIAVNRDPEAPIAEFADVVVVGDLFEVVPALVAALRARTG